MREILFRGKLKDNGEWVEGCLLNFRENTYIIPHDSEYCYDDTEKLAFDVEYFEVLPEIVGQYTGLTDKNSVKIFVGDIVKNHEEDTGVIQWFPEHGAFMIFCTNQNKVYFLYDNDFSKIEVIGNIHDNPELLKGEICTKL